MDPYTAVGRLRRNGRRLLAAGLTVLALAACATAGGRDHVAAVEPLVGLWERVGGDDPFAGMLVRVTHQPGGALAAIIVASPAAAAADGLAVGLVKWRNITPNADGTWRLQDLSMTDGEYWWDMILSFTATDAFTLRDVESQGETGAEQDWVRSAEAAPRGSI